MITLITGENEYAIKQYVDSEVAKFVQKHGADGLERRRAEQLEKSDLPDLFGGVSLFSSERLVIIDRPEQSKELTEHLATNVDTVPDDTNVILVEPKPDKRLKWYKAVSKSGRIVEKKPLPEYAFSRWITETVKERGGQIDSSNSAYLAERIGTNQWQASNEIDKLITYGKKITKQSIDELVEPTLSDTVFQLLDAAVQGNEERALELFNQLRLKDLDPHQTVAMLGWQVHNMLLVKTNTDTNPGELAKNGGMAPFVIQKTKGLVRNLSLGQIKKLIDLILDTEAKIRKTGADAHRQTEHLISQVARITS